MTFDYPVERIIGFDKIEGYLCKDGRVVAGALSSGSWDDVAMSREVYAASKSVYVVANDKGVERLNDFQR